VRRVFADTLYWGAVLHGYAVHKTIALVMTNMRRQRISEVLTNDRHFIQEGFQVVLR